MNRRALVVDDNIGVNAQVIDKLIEGLEGQKWEWSAQRNLEHAARMLQDGWAPKVVIFDLFYGEPLPWAPLNFLLVLFVHLPRIRRMIRSAAHKDVPMFWCYSNYLWYEPFKAPPPGKQRLNNRLFRLAVWLSRLLQPELHPLRREFTSAIEVISGILKHLGVEKLFSKDNPTDLWSAISTLRSQ